FGGRVEKSKKREYGRAVLHLQKEDAILDQLTPTSQVWMSHADTILELPDGFELLATTESIPIAAFRKTSEKSKLKSQKGGNGTHDSGLTTHNFPLYGLQFHPEVYHSIEGKKI